jgi:hypothetical protein
MTQGYICDECGKVYRKEGEYCEPEEVLFGLTRYHFGDGMDLPTGRKKWGFCSLTCFQTWFNKKMKDGFKDVSGV